MSTFVTAMPSASPLLAGPLSPTKTSTPDAPSVVIDTSFTLPSLNVAVAVGPCRNANPPLTWTKEAISSVMLPVTSISSPALAGISRVIESLGPVVTSRSCAP